MKPATFRTVGIVTGVFFLLLWTSSLAFAEEHLPSLRVGKDVYTNVTIMKVTATDVYFTFEKGMANAKLKNLDPVMQKHFGFDAAKAEAISAQQRAAGTRFSLATGSTAELVIDKTNVKAVKEEAINRVKAIVNQPVRQLSRGPGMEVSIYSPGWFHEGAQEPNYSTVDVRTSQDTKYSEHAYVTSDLNPGLAFAGSEVEFNSNTKFFYVDRTLPKKRLSEPEMMEVNRLYRIIGRCNEKMVEPSIVPALSAGFMLTHRKELMMGTGGLLVLLLLVRAITSRRTS